MAFFSKQSGQLFTFHFLGNGIGGTHSAIVGVLWLNTWFGLLAILHIHCMCVEFPALGGLIDPTALGLVVFVTNKDNAKIERLEIIRTRVMNEVPDRKLETMQERTGAEEWATTLEMVRRPMA